MPCHTASTGARRLAHLGGAIVFCLCLCVHLLLALYWAVTGTRPPARVEPRGYVNVLGDLEPRLRLVDREIPDLPYRVTTNSQGFRGKRPVGTQRPAGSLRVLCLGDSYTYGVGVDDAAAYPALLETILQKRLPGREVQVINAGVPFYDIFDELSYFREKGARLKPDVVVLQFYINDLEAMAGSFFREDLLHRQGGVYNAFDQWIGRETVERRLIAWLEGHVPGLYRAVGTGSLPQGPSRAATGQFASFHVEPTEAERALLGDRKRLLTADAAVASGRLWENYRQALLLLRDAVEANGARFLFLIAPDVAQVREDLNQPAAALVPFCREHGINVLDMTRRFRSMSGEEPERYYLLPKNAHHNAAGNTIIAQVVADALRVLPGPARPSVRVEPAEAAFDYADPVVLNLRFGPQGVLPAANGPMRVATARVDNLTSWSVDIGNGQNTIGGLTPDVLKGPVGELVLRLDADVPLDQVSVTMFRKLSPPVNGYVELGWSREDRDYKTLLFASDKDVPEPEGYESGRLAEIDLRDAPAKRLYLRLVLRNEARIFTESKEPPWRRFEVVGYPSSRAATAAP